MKVTLVPSSLTPGDDVYDQFLTTYLVNDTIAVDAGSLGFFGTPHEQARIRHVLISHTHIDHIASLPVFVENAYEGRRDCVTIYGSEAVLDCLRHDIFNDRVWPDFPRLSKPEAPFLRLERLEDGCPLVLDGVTVTPVAVDHVVPTQGLILEEPGTAVVIVGDTGPTEEIWRRTNATPDLKAVFLEAAFPDHLAWLADVSKHLTPSLFSAEARKLRPGVRLLAVHIKARYLEQVSDELRALGRPEVEICRPGQLYEF